MASITLSDEDLRPIVEAAVAAAVAKLADLQAQTNGRLCYTEQEAAQLMDLEPRQLADERKRGRIRASAIVGKRIRYRREDLLEYLASRPWKPA